MTSSSDDMKETIAKFKQDVFAKLTFLGMPRGDAAAMRHLWKFINLCTKLCTSGESSLGKQLGIRQIFKALSKDLGAQRAGEFQIWVTERMPSDFAKFQKTNVSNFGKSKVSECTEPQVEAIAFLKSEGRSKLDDQHRNSQIGVMLTQMAPCTTTHVALAESATTLDSVLAESAQGVLSQSAASVETEKIQAHAAEVFDEAFVEVKSKDGKIYYWDRRTKGAVWTLPTGVCARWVSYKTPTGRTYYSDRSETTCKTVWLLPALDASKELANEVETTQGCSNRMQPSEATFFLPELGLLKPLVLPAVPFPLKGGDDLGPFEFVLRPETPVLTSCVCSHEAEQLNSSECRASSDTFKNVKINVDSALIAKPNLGSHEENESMKKDLQIKLLACKLENMSADTSSLREELVSLRKHLAGLGEKSRSIPRSEDAVSVDPGHEMSPLCRKASTGRSIRGPTSVGSQRARYANSDVESESSVASDVTNLSSDSEEDDQFDTYRARSCRNLQNTRGKRNIEKSVFERASKRRSSLGGA